MKRFVIAIGMAALLCVSQTGCRKFLDTESPTKESGASFWKTKSDVERFTNNLYSEIADVMLNNSFFLVAEFRCGIYRQTSASSSRFGRDYFELFAFNNLKAIMKMTGFYADNFRFADNANWQRYYQVIQSAGILTDRIDDISNSEIPAAEKRRYKAEAVWVRNFLYFVMVRLYGDVPYYNKPYFNEIIARTKFTDVLNSCIADMAKYKDDLPWAYSDPKMKAVRPTRGAALALMMHMNMWNAGFNESKKDQYYKAAADLGKELIEQNGGAHRLLTVSEFKRLFRGGSEEGLFELTQNMNYGEVRTQGWQYLNDAVLNHDNYGMTYVNYVGKFLEKMYPLGVADKRKDLWFDASTMYRGGDLVEFRKFIGNFTGNVGNENISSDGNLIVFRYADAILLASEANAELGNDAEAIRLLNMIRARAETISYSGGGGTELKDAIFWERAKEMMGEGHAFYDLVRTHRILNSEYCTAPISQSAFQRGAWTWPIAESALTNNPLMKLNDYWR